MKATHLLTTLACAVALYLFVGCAGGAHVEHTETAATPVYETADQIKAMPPCKARVVERAPCYVGLKATDGKKFYVGGPGSKADVTRFLGELREGQSYDFPDAFVSYQSNRPSTSP